MTFSQFYKCHVTCPLVEGRKDACEYPYILDHAPANTGIVPTLILERVSTSLRGLIHCWAVSIPGDCLLIEPGVVIKHFFIK